MLPTDIKPATFSSAQFFTHPNWVYELKYDGFRGLALIDWGQVTLVSKTGHVYKRFPTLCTELCRCFKKSRELVLDGEICCLDSDGRPRFYDLMFRRGDPVFCAFDILWSNNKDMRSLPLLIRKKILRKLIPAGHSHLLYVDHTEDGQGLYDLVCANDLEGVVAKPKASTYGNDKWLKFLNAGYSQKQDRHELFNRK